MAPPAFFTRFNLGGLILMLAIASVLLTLGNGFYVTYKSQRELLINNTLEANRAYAAKLAAITSETLIAAQRQLAYSAKMLSEEMNNDSFIASEVQRLHKQSNTFNSVVIVDHQAVVLDTSPEALSIKGKKLTTPVALQSTTEKKPIITEPFISAANNYLISLSHPVFSTTGQYLGYVAGAIYLEEDSVLNAILGLHYYKDGSYLYVVDRNSTIIYHPHQHRIGQQVTNNIAIDAAVSGHSDAYSITNSQGIDMLAGFAPVAESGWGIVAQRPKSSALSGLDGQLLNVFIKSIPLTLVILAGIWWAAYYISQPLAQLARSAKLMDNDQTKHNISRIKAWYLEVALLKQAILKGMGLLNSKISKLHADSHTDAMTGLLNRRGMEQALYEYQEAAQAFSVITLDIDYFKKVNDTYGHDVGDEVLKELANIMKANARQPDAVCRVGGDELIILLPSTPLNTAFSIAERLRHQVAEQPMPNEVGYITISLGIAYWAGHPTAISDVLKWSDVALYQAKQQGRNRTVVAEWNNNTV